MFGALRFLYTPTSDTARDVAWYQKTLGAELVWRFQAFGADVAGLKVGEGPLVLLADHRHGHGATLPIWQVDDLAATMKALEKKGWKAEGDPFGIPNGDCVLFKDPTGNEWALFEDMRPGAMEAAYAEETNARAVR